MFDLVDDFLANDIEWDPIPFNIMTETSREQIPENLTTSSLFIFPLLPSLPSRFLSGPRGLRHKSRVYYVYQCGLVSATKRLPSGI